MKVPFFCFVNISLYLHFSLHINCLLLFCFVPLSFHSHVMSILFPFSHTHCWNETQNLILSNNRSIKIESKILLTCQWRSQDLFDRVNHTPNVTTHILQSYSEAACVLMWLVCVDVCVWEYHLKRSYCISLNNIVTEKYCLVVLVWIRASIIIYFVIRKIVLLLLVDASTGCKISMASHITKEFILNPHRSKHTNKNYFTNEVIHFCGIQLK